MTNSHDFPAEFPADAAGSGDALRWTIGVLVPTALALAVLNAEAIVNWTQELPAGPRTARVMAAAESWHAGTAALGLAAPREELHHAWKSAQAARWSPGPSDQRE